MAISYLLARRTILEFGTCRRTSASFFTASLAHLWHILHCDRANKYESAIVLNAILTRPNFIEWLAVHKNVGQYLLVSQTVQRQLEMRLAIYRQRSMLRTTLIE
jgi:hypothetical protein